MQYKELEPAKQALASMNGFELAGRSSKSGRQSSPPWPYLTTTGHVVTVKVSTVHEKGTSAGQVRPPVEQQLEDTGNYGKRDRSDSVALPAHPQHLIVGTKMDASARQQLMYKLARQPDPSVPGNMTSPVAATSVNFDVVEGNLVRHADRLTYPNSNRLNIPAQQTQFVQLSNMFTEE